MSKPFQVYLIGSFYASSLYDEQGKEINDLDIAAEESERQYPGEWKEIANGEEGASRDEWLAMKAGHEEPE